MKNINIKAIDFENISIFILTTIGECLKIYSQLNKGFLKISEGVSSIFLSRKNVYKITYNFIETLDSHIKNILV
tara:strand:- start:461 stop:682 length:222 start_codon:yes stop_codon:yes gene_type:complete